MMYVHIEAWETPSWQKASLSPQEGKIQSLHFIESWKWRQWPLQGLNKDLALRSCSLPCFNRMWPCQRPQGTAAAAMMTEFTSSTSSLSQDFVIFSFSSQDKKKIVAFSFHKIVMSGECLPHCIFCFDKGGWKLTLPWLLSATTTQDVMFSFLYRQPKEYTMAKQ